MGRVEIFLEQAGNAVGGFLWGPFMLAAFLTAGLWFTVCTGGFQFTHIALWWRSTAGQLFKKRQTAKGQFTAAQSATTVLASTIGTGNIAGVATAIALGGPGAVVWMWVSALLGMATAYAENLLGVLYRKQTPNGKYVGGAYMYIEKALHHRFFGGMFAFFCLLASLGMGNMTQSNAAADAVKAIAGHLGAPASWGRGLAVATGVGLVLAVAPMVLGGISRAGKACEKMVPTMALAYVVAGSAVILANIHRLPAVLAQMLIGALRPSSAMAGIGGYTLLSVMRQGIARGVFSNEAGLGSAVAVHAVANEPEAVRQGMWGIFEVFVDTLLLCTVTALAVLCSGVYSAEKTLSFLQKGVALPNDMQGVGLTQAAFSTVFGSAGGILICIFIILFAFSTLMGWFCIGEQAFCYLARGERLNNLYKGVYLATVFCGSLLGQGTVWQWADIFNGLMALPNLAALFLLWPQVSAESKRFLKAQKSKKELHF